MFGKLKIGHCEVDVKPSNGVKPKVEKQGDHLLITPKCVCGKVQGTFNIADRSSLIIERAAINIKEAEEKGRRRTFQADESELIHCVCPVCPREFFVRVHFKLVKQWIKRFKTQHKHGHKQIVYGGAIKIDIEIKNGYFEGDRRQPLRLTDLKHACGDSLMPRELFEANQRMIESIDAFWHTKGAENVKFKGLKLKGKCNFCLGKYVITASFTPLLPTSETPIAEIIERYKRWIERTL